ncbi:hypothetical protein SAMN05444395_102268 [Flavobacterium fryxellicola]|nr:hypothetical protein SAMN05444395_102268 [Flavobacterium fryxellicola]
MIELFSFPSPPQRLSSPEAAGMHHLAFEVNDIQKTRGFLVNQCITAEVIRVDEHTRKRFLFSADPDDLPIEFYEK